MEAKTFAVRVMTTDGEESSAEYFGRYPEALIGQFVPVEITDENGNITKDTAQLLEILD